MVKHAAKLWSSKGCDLSMWSRSGRLPGLRGIYAPSPPTESTRIPRASAVATCSPPPGCGLTGVSGSACPSLPPRCWVQVRSRDDKTVLECRSCRRPFPAGCDQGSTQLWKVLTVGHAGANAKKSELLKAERK